MATGRLGSSTSITGTVRQQTRSVIAAQSFAPKPNVSLTELNDINVSGVQDKQVLQFDSATGKFVANTVTATVVSVQGGSF
jgi:hypothetical protein